MKKPFLFAALLFPAFLFCQNEAPFFPKTEVEASFNYRYIGNTLDLGIARNWRVLTLRAGLNARLWSGRYLNEANYPDIYQRGIAEKPAQYVGLNLGMEAHLRHRRMESFSPYLGYDVDFSYLPLRTLYTDPKGFVTGGQSTPPALAAEAALCLGFKVRLFGKVYLNQSCGWGLGFYGQDIQQNFGGPLFPGLFPDSKAEFIGPIAHLGLSRAVDWRRRK